MKESKAAGEGLHCRGRPCPDVEHGPHWSYWGKYRKGRRTPAPRAPNTLLGFLGHGLAVLSQRSVVKEALELETVLPPLR